MAGRLAQGEAVRGPDLGGEAAGPDATAPAPLIGALRTPAQLQTATDTVTPFGGRTRVWSTVSVIWLALTPGRGIEVVEPGLPPRRRDRAAALARDHPAAVRGARLVIGAEPPWRILDVSRRAPTRGFMTLNLERET